MSVCLRVSFSIFLKGNVLGQTNTLAALRRRSFANYYVFLCDCLNVKPVQDLERPRETRYDRGITFRLNCFLDEGAP